MGGQFHALPALPSGENSPVFIAQEYCWPQSQPERDGDGEKKNLYGQNNSCYLVHSILRDHKAGKHQIRISCCGTYRNKEAK